MNKLLFILFCFLFIQAPAQDIETITWGQNSGEKTEIQALESTINGVQYFYEFREQTNSQGEVERLFALRSHPDPITTPFQSKGTQLLKPDNPLELYQILYAGSVCPKPSELRMEGGYLVFRFMVHQLLTNKNYYYESVWQEREGGFHKNREIQYELAERAWDGKSDYPQFDTLHYWDRNYYPDGNLRSEGHYDFLSKMPVGMCRKWFEGGNLQEECKFLETDSTRIEVRGFHENGSLAYEGFQSNSQNTGEWQFYYMADSEDIQDDSWEIFKGHIQQQGVFEHGKRVGAWKYWRASGQSMTIRNFHQDESLLMKYWNKEGKLLINNGKGTRIEWVHLDGVLTKLEVKYKNGLPFSAKWLH